MDGLPEELKTPPAPLVALVGTPDLHSEISASLHSGPQPPVDSFSVSDFSGLSYLLRKFKDPLAAAAGRPRGILKRRWLAKHLTRVPAVVLALFPIEHVCGDPAEWLQLCYDVEKIKSTLFGRNIRLVIVVVLSTVDDYVNDNQMTSLRKHAEVDPNCFCVFVRKGQRELRQSLIRICTLCAELCTTYYREEGQMVRDRVERKSFSCPEMHVRYCFKVAVYAEFRRDWVEALRFYQDAYSALCEMIGTPRELPPIQSLVEIKAVAEQLHLKISTLLLHSGKVVEAIDWLWNHISCHEKHTGGPEFVFLHKDWLSKQYLVFAGLFETRCPATPDTSGKFLTEAELTPAYYFQLAARSFKDKNSALDVSLSILGSPGNPVGQETTGNRTDSIVPSVCVGQYIRMVKKGEDFVGKPLTDLDYLAYAIAEGKKQQNAHVLVGLLRKSSDLYNNLKAQRMSSYCIYQMAKEFFASGDFTNAKTSFDSITSLYRREGWLFLLSEILGYLRECSIKLGFLKDYVEYSLEMASLPTKTGSFMRSLDPKGHCRPDDSPRQLQREIVQEEAFRILRGEPILTSNYDHNSIGSIEQPLYIEISPLCPMRTAFLVSAAFHDQSIKPGGSALLTISLLSRLPLPVEVDQVELQFNQPACNFKIINVRRGQSATRSSEKIIQIEKAPNITLLPNKWTELTYSIIPDQSGKLECLKVLARIQKRCTICFHPESPASVVDKTDMILWRSEVSEEALPTKDPSLALTGQKFVQVEEPEPLVDLILSSHGPALVGETFPVFVSVTAKGHMICSGELKINLVDNRGGLLAPRNIDSLSSENQHVILAGISPSMEEKHTQSNNDIIKKIQQSFGLLSVPFLNVGESWSCRLDIRWQRPELVLLYVSLGYSPNRGESTSQKVHIYKSLEIEGKTAIEMSHEFMMPCRRNALLVSSMKQVASASEELVAVGLHEKNILLVTTKNCSEVPLRLMSTFERDDVDKDACVVSRDCALDFHSILLSQCAENVLSELVLMPGEEFKQIFSFIPNKPQIVHMGSVCVRWKRESELIKSPGVVVKQKIPNAKCEKVLLVACLDCPPYAILGIPFSFSLSVHNRTLLVQEIHYSVPESQCFILSGPCKGTSFVFPNSKHVLTYTMIPLLSGTQELPQVTVTSARYSARLQTCAWASKIFILPSKTGILGGSLLTKGNTANSDSELIMVN